VERKTSAWVGGRDVDINNVYILGKQIGQPGQYGRAVVAEKRNPGRDEPRQYAVKIIQKTRFRGNKKVFQSFRDEVDIMAQMDHPNIIKCYEAYEDREYFYIVTELCTGGELFDRLTSKGKFSEADAAVIMRQLFGAIDYMHRVKGVCHCDLKPDNCLFESNAPDARLKLIDFGMAKIIRPKNTFREFCGTPYYVAPEVLEGRFRESADIWSLGVILFVLLHGYPPFHADQKVYGNRTDDEIFRLVREGFHPVVRPGYKNHFPEKIPISQSARALITRLIEKDVAKRPSAHEALEDPWFSGGAVTTAISPSVFESLTKFQNTSKFRSLMLETMTNFLSEVEVKQLKESFIRMDTNHDGTITVDELRRALKEIRPDVSEQEVWKIMRQADQDNDGRLSYRELYFTALDRKVREKEERMLLMFKEIDRNGDGKLSPDEISRALRDRGIESNVVELLRQVDKDGNGLIDYDEFLEAWGRNEMLPDDPAQPNLGLQAISDPEHGKPKPKEITPSPKPLRTSRSWGCCHAVDAVDESQH